MEAEKIERIKQNGREAQEFLYKLRYAAHFKDWAEFNQILEAGGYSDRGHKAMLKACRNAIGLAAWKITEEKGQTVIWELQKSFGELWPIARI